MHTINTVLYTIGLINLYMKRLLVSSVSLSSSCEQKLLFFNIFDLVRGVATPFGDYFCD